MRRYIFLLQATVVIKTQRVSGIAVVDDNGALLSNVSASDIKVHPHTASCFLADAMSSTLELEPN
jgi:hypothetical protein